MRERVGIPAAGEVTRFHIQLMMDMSDYPEALAKENAMAKLDYKELNAVQQYSQHAVFKVIPGALGTERAEIIAQAQKFFADVEEAGKVTVRGIYDLTAMRDSADFMIWWHADTIEQLQDAYHRAQRLRRTERSDVTGMISGMIGLAPCSASAAATRSRNRR